MMIWYAADDDDDDVMGIEMISVMLMKMMSWGLRLLVLCWWWRGWHGDYCCRHDEGNSICNNQVADRLTSGKIEKPPFLDWFAMCLETISCRNPVYLLIAISGTGCAWYNQLLNVCRRQANIRSAAIFQRPTAISRAPLPSGQKNYVAIANGETPLCDFKDVFACGLNTNKPKEIF